MAAKHTHSEPDATPTELTVKVPAHVLKDLKRMEEHSGQSLGTMVTKALMMFIATHRDYLPPSK